MLTFAALWPSGQIVWRIAIALIARVEIRGMEALYIEAMGELLAKDLGFFQSNYSGSLTKRALGYARRFEDVFDVLSFQVAPTVLPLAFVGVVLWSYSPWLLVVLLGMMAVTLVMVIPLIRRRRLLVDIREAASNVLAGHLADSITNAEAVRAFARESDEARIHADNVGDYGAKTLRSWDYQNLRVDLVTSPMFVVTNILGLVVALGVGSGTGANLEVVFITFSYYATATRVMWEFNRIYRNLEGALTDAAQFAELLLEPPSVVDAEATEAVHAGRFRRRASRCQLPVFGITAAAVRSACRSESRRAQKSASSDVRAAARRRSRGFCCDFQMSRRARFSSGGNRSLVCHRRRCERSSAMCRRTRRCFIAASRTTSGWVVPARPTPKCGAPRSSRTRPSSSKRCRSVTTRSSASGA